MGDWGLNCDMENKYFIEVSNSEYEGEIYVSYVNKSDWNSKVPQFFDDFDEATKVKDEFVDCIKRNYGSYTLAKNNFKVIELNSSIETYTELIDSVTKELSSRTIELNKVKLRLDKAIDEGDFEEAHDAIDNYEFIYNKIAWLSEQLQEASKKLNLYESWR